VKTLFIRSLSGLVYVASLLIPLLFVYPLWPWVLLVYAGFIMQEVYSLSRKAGLPLSGLAGSVTLSIGWGAVPLILLGFLPDLYDSGICGQDDREFVLSMLVLVWTSDTFAYLTGKFLGRHKLAPKISPLKTIEGFLGGMVFSSLAAILLAMFLLPEVQVWFWPAAVLLVTVAGTTGDLLQSWLKRRAGVKDSGRLMPGHGGFFDRFDSLLLVIPFWLLLMALTCS